MAGILVSAALHSGVALAAVCWSLAFQRVATWPTQAGPNSISLVASMSSRGDRDDGEVTRDATEASLNLPRSLQSTAPRDDRQASAPRSVVQRDAPAPAGATSRVLDPAESDDRLLASIEPMLLRAVIDRTDDGGSEREAALPRARFSPLLQLDEVRVALRSEPSPSSEALSGADLDQQPSIVYNPAPQYPHDAWRRRQTGTVALAVTIATNGTVREARIYRSSGVAALDDAAMAAIARWRFQPARHLGRAIECTVEVPIRFTLPER
jgi:protein TonB